MTYIQSGIRYIYLLILVIFVGVACQQSTKGNEQPKEQKQKLVFRTEEEVKAFIGENLKKPIPADYKIPSYISSGLPLEQVYDTLKARYPTFYGKEGQSYIQAVMADPETYLKLSLESKSIRRYYDPNSKY
jgi:hypothetical protein